jgi:two-component system sensor histidine kinase/response regulator
VLAGARHTVASVPVNPVRGFAVLVVDDDPDTRGVTRTVLEAEGYQVLLASGGAEAIAVFEAEQPDCILLDVRMPDIDGFTVCERIRELPLGGETPIIFLTGLRDVDTFDRALRAGGTDFLTKPVHAPELAIRVRSAVKLRRMSVELREQYEVLKHHSDVLQRVQLQKERLMAFVVHDLKNPVSSMDLHAQVLLRDAELPPRLRDSATQIRTEARALNRMIMNLLDMSKGDEGLLSPKMGSIDLGLLANEVELELSVMAQSREVLLECVVDVGSLRADADLLRRTLTNLVENALRHAPPRTIVRLSAASRGDATEFRVVDVGSGVPLELRERIFDPFVQLEVSSQDGSSSRSGRGLGLAFCKLAVEAHGGRIWVEDAAPGAAFCVSLPSGA